MSTWANQGVRTTGINRTSNATRNITCFEVLDYDSLTHVKVGKEFRDVVCLIYKKVTITHEQNRKFVLSYVETNVANNKDSKMPARLLQYLDWAPATDEYKYTGTRQVEYLLCLLVGTQKFVLNLGSVNISVQGSYNLKGTNKELIEDAADLQEDGPFFSVTGHRLYGVSVNCGKKVVTYSYDIERLIGSFSNNVMFQYDSPINAEDYNDYWTKMNRVVGAMNYYGVNGSKDFSCDKFPDKVLAVGYKVLSRGYSVGG